MESATLAEMPTDSYVMQVEPLSTGRSVVGTVQEKPPRAKPLAPSKEPFDTKGYLAFQHKSLESKREYLKREWLDIAYLTLYRGKLFARSVTKKDFGKLVQLLMAAGISWDKVFPKVDNTSGINVALNLFNGLPTEKVVRVIGEVPVPTTTPLPTDK